MRFAPVIDPILFVLVLAGGALALATLGAAVSLAGAVVRRLAARVGADGGTRVAAR
jgi:hypothetical protein